MTINYLKNENSCSPVALAMGDRGGAEAAVSCSLLGVGVRGGGAGWWVEM